MFINFGGINAIQALYWSAAINGLLAQPLLFLITRMSNSWSVMGSRTSRPLVNALGWIAAILMTLAALGPISSWIIGG